MMIFYFILKSFVLCSHGMADWLLRGWKERDVDSETIFVIKICTEKTLRKNLP